MNTILFDKSPENVINLIGCLDFFAASLVVPSIAPHLRSIGYSAFMIGTTTSVYSCAQLLSSPIVGHYSDAYGPKRVLFCCLLICSIGYTLLGWSGIFIYFLSIRLVIGAVKHTQLLCKSELAVINTSDSKHVESYGRLNTLSAVGFTIGSTIGGHLTRTEYGFPYACSCSGFVFLCNCAVVWYLLPSSDRHVKRKNNRSEQKYAPFFTQIKAIEWSQYWDIFLIKVLAVTAVLSFVVNYNLHATERYHFSPVILGYTVGFQGFVTAVSGLHIGRLDRLIGLINENLFFKLQAAFGALFLIFLAMYAFDNEVMFVFCLIPFRIVDTFLRVMSSNMLLERARGENTGLLLGTFGNVSSLVRLVVPPVTGLLIDLFGYGSIYGISMLSLAFAFLLSRSRIEPSLVKIE